VNPVRRRSWFRAVAIAAAPLLAIPGCDNADGAFSLPDDPRDASLSDGPAADAAPSACFAQNVCSQNDDCLAATCDCAGQQVTVTERCVAHCCLSVYAACLRACADAGSDAGDAAIDASAFDADADAETIDAAIDVDADDAQSDSPDAATDS
jgi:hypothetical protein